MDLFDTQPVSPFSGIRLERLEIQNWGTFDEAIFVLPYEGRTSLLIGQNGTGKTTLSDAILTLLVENSKRNYNVSASAYGRRKGRNEASYIRGAFKEVSVTGEIQSKSEFLRPAEGTLSVLLAVFRDHGTGALLTLAQILYISGGSAKKVFCHCEGDRSIQNDLSGFRNFRSLKAELKRRDFSVAENQTAYFDKIRSWMSMRPQALDVFNQTVAVKEIQNLNEFIRSYMLDTRDYGPQVQAITEHYKDLETAYGLIQHAAHQLELLKPVCKLGDAYEAHKAKLVELKAEATTRAYFFARRKEQLYRHAVTAAENEQLTHEKSRATATAKRDRKRKEEISLESEKKQKGGRLTDLENELLGLKGELQQKRDQRGELARALKALEIESTLKDPKALASALEAVRRLQAEAPEASERADRAWFDCQTELESIRTRMDADAAELKQLQGRPSNIPAYLNELRETLANTLGIPTSRLPFAGELIQIQDNETEWRLAAELVLRNFGQTLLVPPDVHPQLVEYAETHQLKDAKGKGVLLEYEKVDPDDQLLMQRPPRPGSDYLENKLNFKHSHPFGDWVRREVSERFPIRCTATLDAFREARESAVTREGQIRNNRGRIRKDDREKSRDQKNFILGWDNQAKCASLSHSIREADKRMQILNTQLPDLKEKRQFWSDVKHHCVSALRFSHWDEIDLASTERTIEEKQAEIKAFTDASQDLQQLEQKIKSVREAVAKYDLEIESHTRAIARNEGDIEKFGNSHLVARHELERLSEPTAEALQAVETETTQHYLLTLESIESDDQKSREALDLKQHNTETQKAEAEAKLAQAMTKFLSEFKADGFDQSIKDEVGYLPDFRELYKRINGDRLPEFKTRFRKMARDRVQQELSQFRHHLRNAENEIKDRIDEINQALREIQYDEKTGTYMHLLYLKARHHERDELKAHLDAALSDTVGQANTFESAEAFFRSIEPLLKKLLAEDTWAERACDVRSWFEFAASERRESDDSEVRYLRSTETASGGEKAKLAFTILVAAIIYQYDIDPAAPHQSRFRLAVIDEAFAKVDDRYANYALDLFHRFGLQLIVIAPFDPKARVVEPYADYYVLTAKQNCDDGKDRSQLFTLTREGLEERLREVSEDDISQTPLPPESP